MNPSSISSKSRKSQLPQLKLANQEESPKELQHATKEEILAILAMLPLEPLIHGQRLEIFQFFMNYLGFSQFFDRSSSLPTDEFKRKENEMLESALEFFLNGNIDAAKFIGYCLTPCWTSFKSLKPYSNEADYYLAKNPSQLKLEFINHLTKAADNGYEGRKIAQFAIGKMHLDGDGVAQDTKRAADYFQKSAAQHYQPAIKALGELIKFHYPSENKDKPFDIKKVLLVLEQLTSEGNVNAMFILGEAYLVMNDDSNAIKYFEMADEAHDPQAPAQLAKIYDAQYDNCKVKQFNKHLQKSAINYYLKDRELTANKGDKVAMRELGKLYLSGAPLIDLSGTPPCPPDKEKSEHYLKLAADDDDGEAAFILFEQYGSSNFASSDRGKIASHYLDIAAKAVYPLAVLEQAIANQDPNAAYKLYELYDTGDTSLSLPANKQKAESYLFMAADLGSLPAMTLILNLNDEGKIQCEFPLEQYCVSLHENLKEQATLAFEEQAKKVAETDTEKKPDKSDSDHNS